jgi:hypothetical protein
LQFTPELSQALQSLIDFTEWAHGSPPTRPGVALGVHPIATTIAVQYRTADAARISLSCGPCPTPFAPIARTLVVSWQTRAATPTWSTTVATPAGTCGTTPKVIRPPGPSVSQGQRTRRCGFLHAPPRESRERGEPSRFASWRSAWWSNWSNVKSSDPEIEIANRLNSAPKYSDA